MMSPWDVRHNSHHRKWAWLPPVWNIEESSVGDDGWEMGVGYCEYLRELDLFPQFVEGICI